MHTADWTWKVAADEQNINIGKYEDDLGEFQGVLGFGKSSTTISWMAEMLDSVGTEVGPGQWIP